ncbi:MAG: hypothetical protein JNG86_16570, partial [Verrucomicrobiaceae bacterium]|nr:hypothetical protein [Verrucomicrobiaceae bacterium]
RKGEKLVRWENERTMHAVGAVRAETQCLRCHEGSKAGDLLGAFTYSFAKTGVVPPDEKTAQIVKLHDERKTPLQIAEAVGLLKPPAEAEFPGVKTFAITQLHQALLSQGIVTAEMLAAQAQRRKDVLNSNLGPVKKPKASAGAE